MSYATCAPAYSTAQFQQAPETVKFPHIPYIALTHRIKSLPQAQAVETHAKILLSDRLTYTCSLSMPFLYIDMPRDQGSACILNFSKMTLRIYLNRKIATGRRVQKYNHPYKVITIQHAPMIHCATIILLNIVICPQLMLQISNHPT